MPLGLKKNKKRLGKLVLLNTIFYMNEIQFLESGSRSVWISQDSKYYCTIVSDDFDAHMQYSLSATERLDIRMFQMCSLGRRTDLSIWRLKISTLKASVCSLLWWLSLLVFVSPIL